MQKNHFQFKLLGLLLLFQVHTCRDHSPKLIVSKKNTLTNQSSGRNRRIFYSKGSVVHAGRSAAAYHEPLAKKKNYDQKRQNHLVG